MTMKKMQNLKYIIENELVISCPFLSTDQFISYCKDRGIQTSRKQLERFEKLGIFYPIVRVRYPKIKIKIEYIDNGKRCRNLGILKDGEEWSGDIKEKYAYFEFQKEYAMGWLEEELLWEPASRPFQAWETFNDEHGYTETESFYSIFQCYTRNCSISSGIKFYFTAKFRRFYIGIHSDAHLWHSLYPKR